MASATQNTSLSLPARLLTYLGPPSVVALTALASPRTGLISPLAFVPTIVGLRAWKRSHKPNELQKRDVEPLLWTYACTATIGFAVLVAAQIAIMSAATRLLFPDRTVRRAFIDEFSRASIDGLSSDETARRAVLAMSWRNWVFNTTLSFGMAGLLEELLKAAPIFYLKREKWLKGKKVPKRAYLDYVLASALSFGLVEGIGFIHAACEGGKETGFKLFRTVTERLVLGSTSHALCAALTGLRATRKDFHGDELSWWSVIAPAIALHGTGNTFALGISSLEGNVGWIHPSAFWYQLGLYLSVGSVNVLAAWLVYQEWRQVQSKQDEPS